LLLRIFFLQKYFCQQVLSQKHSHNNTKKFFTEQKNKNKKAW